MIHAGKDVERNYILALSVTSYPAAFIEIPKAARCNLWILKYFDNIQVKLLVKILKPNFCYNSHGSETPKLHDRVNDIPTIHCFLQCLSSLQLQVVQSSYHFASNCPSTGYHVPWIHMWHELQKLEMVLLPK